jgi:1,4-dihydroxy-2-naphthoate octaprenyltransferase
MNKIAVWIKASIIPSQLYIFLPLLLGQAIAFRYNYEFSFFVWVLIHIFGIFNQLYIVYANDYADYEIDKLNDTYNIFSGGSRVLVDGNLNKSQLKKGIYFVVSMNFLVIGLIMLYTKNYMLLPMLIIALLLLWAYSYGPIKLFYRGGGEILQAIGVGTLLPMISFYSQTDNVYMFPFVFLLYISLYN